ncbi:MAG: hypothetical protein U9M89_02025 [Patescibacteria group bacterium]|nr:hypothetical protein [Patescibacteria group bacterium]
MRKQKRDEHQTSCKFNTPEGHEIIMQNALKNTLQDEVDKLTKINTQMSEMNTQMVELMASQQSQIQAQLKDQADKHEREISELKMLLQRPQMTAGRDINTQNITINFNDYDKPSLPSTEELFAILDKHKAGALIPLYQHMFLNPQKPENMTIYTADASRGKMIVRADGRWQAGEPTLVMRRIRNKLYVMMRSELNDNKTTFITAWCTKGMNDGTLWVNKVKEYMERHELNDESDEVKKMLTQTDVVKALVKEFLIENKILDTSGHLLTT